MTDLLGTVDRAAGTVHLERRLASPASRVWAALTQPGRLGDWLAPVESGAPGPDATFVLRMNGDETARCTVMSWDPPHELRLTWDYTGEPPSELVLRLVPDGDGTLLRLDHTRLDVDVVQYGAGWHVHLGNLAVHLDGRDVGSAGCDGPTFLAAWESLAPRYAATDPAS
ncbi:SRPBCC family protein [Actinomycetospora chibensis]|uniref:SRPBCC family protein n=1 Tax=Actinomycetospora chibensis TaxID=663606 RepID=A0ABV9RSQ8_9PSEU|nr:SRPBCC family protein [Actinomycetospora chibensis]MDD7923699.1 SRPBCC family protein [Actinomycetospora chibensis]